MESEFLHKVVLKNPPLIEWRHSARGNNLKLLHNRTKYDY